MLEKYRHAKIPFNFRNKKYNMLEKYRHAVCEVFRKKNRITCYHDTIITLS
jgi:hypothetical protein